MLLAAIAIPGGIAGIAIWIIIAAAVFGIAYVAFKAMGMEIPPWVIQVMWIVVIAIVCIFAIKLLIGAV